MFIGSTTVYWSQEVGVDPSGGPEIVLKIAGGLRRVLSGIRRCDSVPPKAFPRPAARSKPTGSSGRPPVGFITGCADPPWLMVLGQHGFFDRFTVVMSRLSQALAIGSQDHFDDT